MSETRPILRYHPQLPTTEEAKKDHKSFNSDHLPVMSDIPVGDTHLKTISWNVHIPNIGSGYDLIEDKPDEEARSKRTLETIKNIITTQNPDLILLQECYFIDKTNQEKIRELLSEFKWDLAITDSTVTLFNMKRLEKLTLPQQEPVKEGYVPNSLQQSLFKIKQEAKADSKSTETVVVNNVWLQHEDYPHLAEAYILNTLRAGQKHHSHSIVAGDFNNRYVPLGKRSYLPNNVVSGKYRDEILGEPVQGVDWTDGFFYMGRDQKCHQPQDMITLDPMTGKSLPVPEFKLTEFNQLQQAELTRNRPMLCCAEEYRSKQYAVDEKQYFLLADVGVLPGRTVNAINQKREEKHIIPRRNNRHHLESLDKCVTLLNDPDPLFSNIVCEYLAGKNINAANALEAAMKSKPEYKWENPTLKEILLKTQAEVNDQTTYDLLIKTKLLLQGNTPATRDAALTCSVMLLDQAPKLGLQCMHELKLENFPAEKLTGLRHKIIISHIKNILGDLDKAFDATGSINFLKRQKLTKQKNELKRLLGMVNKMTEEQAMRWVLEFRDPREKDTDLLKIKTKLKENLDDDKALFLGFFTTLEPEKKPAKSP